MFPVPRVVSADPTPVTSDAVLVFHDLESLHNVFTVTMYRPPTPGEPVARVWVHHLVDDPLRGCLDDPMVRRRAEEHIRRRNPALPAETVIVWEDLWDRDAGHALCRRLAACDVDVLTGRSDGADTGTDPQWLSPVIDLDPGFDPMVRDAILCGYNSRNYDLVMLAHYLGASVDYLWYRGTSPVIPADLRGFNDLLFTDFRDHMVGALERGTVAERLYRGMLATGRHVDVARLNESQSRVGLKRLLGMIGRQILESDRLDSTTAHLSTPDELMDLVAYNVADCVGLHHLFVHAHDGGPIYSTAFDLRARLLATYPDTRTEPVRGGRRMRWDRLAVDDTSARFIRTVLAPRAPLTDLDTVSLRYPHPDVARAWGWDAPMDVIAEVTRFCHEQVVPLAGVDLDDPAQRAALTAGQRRLVRHHRAFRERFDAIMAWYRALESRDFNADRAPDGRPPRISDVPKIDMNLPWVDNRDPDDPFTDGYVTFSTGGIHGAEADRGLFHHDRGVVAYRRIVADYVRSRFGAPAAFIDHVKQQARTVLTPDGVLVDRARVLTGVNPGTARWRRADPAADPERAAMLEAAQAAWDTPADLLAALPEDRGTRWTPCDHDLVARWQLTLAHTRDLDAGVAAPDPTAHAARCALLARYGVEAGSVEPYAAPLVDDPFMGLVLHHSPDDPYTPQGPDAPVAVDEGVPISALLTSTSRSTARWRDEPVNPSGRDVPRLFAPRKRNDPGDGSTLVHDRYVRTSAAVVVHEDFSSYYPNLLRHLKAFNNPDLGHDPYAALVDRKDALSRVMRDPGRSDAERAQAKVERAGVKLLLNAASGAADTLTGRNPIRMNNRIISMRIIGQLLTWWVVQAQVLAGGRPVSINTDGAYIGVDPDYTVERNNRVLAEVTARIGITIEPEPMFCISKDANNRLELDWTPSADPDSDGVAGSTGDSNAGAPSTGMPVWPGLADAPVIAASGGTLGCYTGPDPRTSLAHPALVDAVLVRYLPRVVAAGGEAALRDRFNPGLADELIDSVLAEYVGDPVGWVAMVQQMVAASHLSLMFPFAVSVADAEAPIDDTAVVPRMLQMVNRVVLVTPDTPGAVCLRTAHARIHTGATQPPHPVAEQVLAHHGWQSRTVVPGVDAPALRTAPRLVSEGRQVVVERLTGVDPTWPVLVVNEDLHHMDAGRFADLRTHLAVDHYRELIGGVFERTWRNR